MSAEQSRLRSAIQRIAREDLERSGSLDSSSARGGQPGGAGVGESDGERDRICCDGSTSDSANPGTSERDTSDGGQDGLDPNDPASLKAGPGELTGVVDCATGQPACLDGDAFIPPEGWDDPGIPPVDGGYEEGAFWQVSTWLGTFYYQTEGSARIKLVETCEATKLEPGCGNLNCGLAGITFYYCGSKGGDMSQKSCASLYNSICDEPPPTADSWPEDGCVNLAIIGGSIVGSKYDPENDGSYSAPRDEIELCDLENGTSILIRPSADGGWKSIESLDGDIDPETGNGYLYAPDGKRIRQISPSEFRDDMV